MDKLIEKFIESTSTGNLWFAVLLLIVVFFLKKEPFKIFTHFEEKRNKDIEQLINAIKIPPVSA